MGGGRRYGAAMVLLPVLSLGLVGCAGGGTSAARARGDAGPVHTSPSGSSQVGGGDGAVTTYRAMWRDLEVAGLTADPASPRLSDHATGSALRLLKFGLSKYRRDGEIIKGAVVLSPQVNSAASSASPTLVKIFDCADDSHWLVYKRDGTLKDDIPGGRYETKATVQRFGDKWKVAGLTMGEVGSC